MHSVVLFLDGEFVMDDDDRSWADGYEADDEPTSFGLAETLMFVWRCLFGFLY